MTLLLSVTLKISLLTLAALALTAVLRRRSAAMRHWVLATTMVCCLCVPAVELLLPAWSIPLPVAWLTSSGASSLRLSSDAPATQAASPALATTTDDASTSGAPSLGVLIAAIWLGGAAIGFAVLSVGLLRLRALAAESASVSTGVWRAVADRVAARYGIRQHVRLLRCRHPTLLATWGLVRPTILLPEGAETWTEDRVHAVLHHELAHILRGDWAVSLAASTLKSVYWFNPLLWVACRRLRHESERACDDLVLASGISAPEYATHLLDVARESSQRRHPWSPAIAIAHHSMLERRVRAMLNSRLNHEPLTAVVRATTLIAIAAVVMCVGVVTLSGNTERIAAPDVRLVPSGILTVPTTETAKFSNAPRASQTAIPLAQTPTRGGTIEGVLYDQFGGLLPGASVRLTQVANGSSQNSMTDRGGLFVFRDLPAGDYEVAVTELPGFMRVNVVVRAEPGATVRRHITLPIGNLEETIHVTCSTARLDTSRPSAPAGSAAPGAANKQAGPRGEEPKIPSTFTGGIGGQIRVPRKLSHTNPVCPMGAAPESTVVKLAGRIGIDGLFTDLHDVSNAPAPYAASALDATRQWVFTPTLLNGAPIEVNINVTVSYSWSN
jgi:beta-lactamase regulating signal transducer with metallopeptidase domain